MNVYGPTEATVCTSMQIYEPEGPFESISIGKPIPNTELLVLDENMYSIDDGELYIVGPGVARGYFRDEILTAAKFVHHNGKLMYKTGDRVAVKSDGDILVSIDIGGDVNSDLLFEIVPRTGRRSSQITRSTDRAARNRKSIAPLSSHQTSQSYFVR